jgi:pimeloyl-ACP methyl ester carboxylesterase
MRNIKHVATMFGEIAYEESGAGPVALFVHGVFLNGYLWRHVIEQLKDSHRCIAIDLMAHGATKTAQGQDVDFNSQAEMIAAFCDALNLGELDLVANDSGGGIAQIFAANHGKRLRSLTLTNCDAHDNWPPAALKPLMDASKAGKLGELGRGMLNDVEFARRTLSVGYEYPEKLSAETIKIYLEPIFGTSERISLFEKWFSQMDCGQTVAVEAKLRKLEAPTLIVWGTGDVFFDLKWAYWLKDTIPNAEEVVTFDGAKLFFPEERPTALVNLINKFWSTIAVKA